MIRLAAAIARFTRAGAPAAGSRCRPRSSPAWRAGAAARRSAPPLAPAGLRERPPAGGAPGSATHGNAVAHSRVRCRRRDGKTLSYAYGVSCRARAERARASSRIEEIRPSGFRHLGSPVPQPTRIRRAAKLADPCRRSRNSVHLPPQIPPFVAMRDKSRVHDRVARAGPGESARRELRPRRGRRRRPGPDRAGRARRRRRAASESTASARSPTARPGWRARWSRAASAAATWS